MRGGAQSPSLSMGEGLGWGCPHGAWVKNSDTPTPNRANRPISADTPPTLPFSHRGGRSAKHERLRGPSAPRTGAVVGQGRWTAAGALALTLPSRPLLHPAREIGSGACAPSPPSRRASPGSAWRWPPCCRSSACSSGTPRGRAPSPDLLALGPAPLELAALAKCLAQWITAGAPLSLLAPIAAIALGAPPSLAPLTLLAALIGALGFSFCGGIGVGVALSLGSRRGGC